jgi:hypothetical protein
VAAEPDLPVLEVLEAAPGGEVPVDKLEPLLVLLYARKLLRSAPGLQVMPPNGSMPIVPSLPAAVGEAIRRRAALRSGDSYRLTKGAGLLLSRRGLRASEQTRALAQRVLRQDASEILHEAARAWPEQDAE